MTEPETTFPILTRFNAEEVSALKVLLVEFPEEEGLGGLVRRLVRDELVRCGVLGVKQLRAGLEYRLADRSGIEALNGRSRRMGASA